MLISPKTRKKVQNSTYFLIGFKHVTFEHIRGSISGNVAENFRILRIMRNVKNSAKIETEKKIILPINLIASS